MRSVLYDRSIAISKLTVQVDGDLRSLEYQKGVGVIWQILRRRRIMHFKLTLRMGKTYHER